MLQYVLHDTHNCHVYIQYSIYFRFIKHPLFTHISQKGILKIHFICVLWFNLHRSKFIHFLTYYLPLPFILVVTRRSIYNCYPWYAVNNGVVSKLTFLAWKRNKHLLHRYHYSTTYIGESQWTIATHKWCKQQKTWFNNLIIYNI